MDLESMKPEYNPWTHIPRSKHPQLEPLKLMLTTPLLSLKPLPVF